MLDQDSGHIQWLDNHRYRLVFYLGTKPNGRRRKVYRRGSGSPSRAEAHRKRVLRELRSGGVPGPRMLVGELLDRYCLDRAGDWRPASQRAFAMQVGRLTAEFGRVPLTALTRTMVTDFKAHALKNGGRRGQPLSAKYVREHLSLLLSALDFGVEEGWLDSNGIRRKKLLPKATTKPVEWLEIDEIEMLLEASAGADIEPVIRILLDTGLRIGEILGVRWRDINLADGTISVVYQLQGRPSLSSHVDTKSEAGQRRIPFGQSTRALIEAMRSDAEVAHSRFGGPPMSGWSVISRGLGRPIPYSSARHQMAGVIHRLHWHDRLFHTLRHTYATHMLRAGLDVKTLSLWLGHKDPAFTLRIYAHAIRTIGRYPSYFDDLEQHREGRLVGHNS